MPEREQRDLHPIAGPHGKVVEVHLGGPLRFPDPRFAGTIDFHCPHCGTVLVIATTVEGVEQVGEIQCYACHKWASGHRE